MTRYINVDKVKPDCISTKGGVAISQSQLANQPTADVIERSKIDKAIEEMESIDLVMFCDEMRDYCVEILKRNIGE